MYTKLILTKENIPTLEQAIKTFEQDFKETENGQDMILHIPSAMVIFYAYLKIATSELQKDIEK